MIYRNSEKHDLAVYKHLTFLFEHLPNVEFLMKQKLLEDFLPGVKTILEHYR